MNHLILGNKLGYINDNNLTAIKKKIEKISAQISALRNYYSNH